MVDTRDPFLDPERVEKLKALPATAARLVRTAASTLNLVATPPPVAHEQTAITSSSSSNRITRTASSPPNLHGYMDGKMTLGTAVAISGAAASPNMGSITPTAAVAMLLTLLNVRLGFWAPNPLSYRWSSAQARLWPFYTIREFLSNTNDLSSYCYLTDGGHFDNTGVYSLIERGCRLIVVADCGADPESKLADLGNAMRRCRIDFGTTFWLDARPLRPLEKGHASVHLVIGRFEYSQAHLEALSGDGPCSEGMRRGVIVWTKPAVTGDESADVLNYWSEHSDFPQQSTANQFFDEAQFESYRALGLHTATALASLLPDLAAVAEGRGIDTIIRRIWKGNETQQDGGITPGNLTNNPHPLC